MEIFITLAIILAIFIPYILAVSIIGVVNTKLIKNKRSKILIITVILLCVFIISINTKYEKTDDLYIEMNEINENKELIGLSREEVIELLGMPIYEYVQEEHTVLKYNGGNIEKGLYIFNKAIFFDSYEGYKLEVFFNEDNKVESTSFQYAP